MRPIPVANSLLRLGFKHKVNDLNAMRVQKLLYFVHGWHLAITNEALIDGGFVKGKYGPVIPEIKDRLEHYGSLPVDDYIKELDKENAKMVGLFVNPEVYPKFNSILNTVWTQYNRFTTPQLSTMTHSEGTPWAKTEYGEVISDALIAEYFRNQAQKNRKNPCNI